jgi:hypothetical protein
MADFNVRSDSVNVEQIMERIRARIREKRGVDYTEQQIRELAAVKLEKFLDPKVVRSDLLQHFQRSQSEQPVATSYEFEDHTLFDSPRPVVRKLRKLLRPVLKMFINPDPLIQALHIQARINELRPKADHLYYELFHNLVMETTRLSIEVKNLKMKVESLTGRLEFNERRARALESVVAYQPAEEPVRRPAGQHQSSDAHGRPGPGPGQAPVASGADAQAMSPAQAPSSTEGPGQRSRRRRRRRGRRGGGSAAAMIGGTGQPSAPGQAGSSPSDSIDPAHAAGDSAPGPEPAAADSGSHAARDLDQGPDDEL